MIKLKSLRQALIEANPSLQRDPDQLLTFAENGSIRYHVGENLSHGYTFTAKIVLLEFGGEVDSIILPLLRWLSVHEPGIVPDEAVSFEVEILKHDAIDLELTVQLTERVVVTQDEDGRHVATHYGDPRIVEDYGPTPWDIEVRHNPDGR